MSLMKDSGIIPDEIAYGAAIDAHRRSGNSLLAVECLNEMQKKGIEPSAAHYNLVLRTLKANGYAEKMYRMLLSLDGKEGSRINGNSYELTIEALLDEGMWKESLLIVKLMNQSIFQPSLDVSKILMLPEMRLMCIHLSALTHRILQSHCRRVPESSRH